MYIPSNFIVKENLCHGTCTRKKAKVKFRARDTKRASIPIKDHNARACCSASRCGAASAQRRC